MQNPAAALVAEIHLVADSLAVVLAVGVGCNLVAALAAPALANYFYHRLSSA